MCRSKEQAGNRKNVRCISCENPDKRRARQNLAYHLKKAQGNLPVSSTSLLDKPELDTTEKIKQENAFPQAVENIVEVVKIYRDKNQNKDMKEWLNLSDHFDYEDYERAKAIKEQEITAIGSVLSAKIEEIAGMSYDEAYEQYHDNSVAKELSVQNQQRWEEYYKLSREIGDLRNEEDADMLDNLRQENLEFRKKASDAYGQYLSRRDQIQNKFTQATKQVLNDVREFGGVVKIEGKKASMVKMFQKNISETTPKDWIDASNTLSKYPIYIDQSKKRAHYVSAKFMEENTSAEVTETKPSSDFAETGYKPHPEDDLYKGWEYDEETKTWSGTQRHKEGRVESDYNNGYYAYDYVYSTGEYKPRNSKYVKWQRGKSFNYQTGQLEECYYHKVHSYTTSYSTKHYIRVYAQYENRKIVNTESFNSVASHEFNHHIETLSPKIVAMQDAFLIRRTTLEDGTREPLVSYLKKSDEQVREDNFVSVYMGKEYFGKKNHEVLTTGSEALFHNKYGSLLGFSDTYKRKDYDMRNFLLGVYATL